ncbi:MAG: lactate utilization protein [Firmicutes bacterium]|nr:lactate utilization protein [Bacillota bacterium]
MRSNRFDGRYAKDRQEACDLVLSLIPQEATIGLGDSVTIEEIGVLPRLKERGNVLYERYRPGLTPPVPDDEKNKYLALTSDVFLTGVNAVTTGGQLIFVDGAGTRAGPVVFGPKRVIVVAGVNKIVRTLEEGLARVRHVAAPLNARRHKMTELPCARGSECLDCDRPDKICCATVILEHCWHKFPGRISVVLVGERLGF